MIKTKDALNRKLLNEEISRTRGLLVKTSVLLYEHEYASKINGVRKIDVETIAGLNKAIRKTLYNVFAYSNEAE